MIPKKIRPYFRTIRQTMDGDNSLIEGLVTCCNASDFEIFAVGEIKNSFPSKMFLLPKSDRSVVEARCKICGKVISVFDNSCDGYERCGLGTTTPVSTIPINCRKCQERGFSVHIRYEYPDIQELEDLNISEIDNAFTWIWIALECNKCGASYKNFIDYETT